MSMIQGKRGLIGGLALSALMLAGASAQANDLNWQANPTYGSVSLSAGFMPDPHRVSLSAGGSTQVTSSLGSGCTGYVHAGAPDVDLYYTAGSLPLYIHVESRADTTLVINAPDGRWYCNDDAIGLNPMVSFPKAQSGMYNIWVGVWGNNELRDATLNITEIDPSR
ncbi:hypothetical protein [Halomonas sp. 328]|uniref:hypothetical protein n=1 Tax=Halomonas sp. 328 TaxID=2776704 RepID=UPI001E5194C1|nr:hypothetical protein [Halomonas sp. 328]